jgi:methyl-accepting chemotaxis protein
MSTEAPKKPRLLRRKWVVRPTYQNQFAVVLVAFQINVGLLYLGIMQFRMRSLLEQAGSLQVLLETNLWSAFLPWIAAISGALGAIVWMIGLFFSNSIVGPVPRLQRALQAMAAGDFSQRLKFRPGDALEDLATDVNALAERLADGTIGQNLSEDEQPNTQEEEVAEPEPTGVGV